MQEQVAGKHRHWHNVPLPGPAQPGLDCRQKHMHALGGQLIPDELLEMTAHPHRKPLCPSARLVARGLRRDQLGIWQGFAPLGLLSPFSVPTESTLWASMSEWKRRISTHR